MPPKKPKKTKEEIEAEKRIAEEARLEEERKKRIADELEKSRAAQAEKERLARVEAQRNVESLRLELEHAQVADMLYGMALKRAQGDEERAAQNEWRATLNCSPLPAAHAPAQLNDHLVTLDALKNDVSVTHTELLTMMNDCEVLVQELERAQARQPFTSVAMPAAPLTPQSSLLSKPMLLNDGNEEGGGQQEVEKMGSDEEEPPPPPPPWQDATMRASLAETSRQALVALAPTLPIPSSTPSSPGHYRELYLDRITSLSDHVAGHIMFRADEFIDQQDHHMLYSYSSPNVKFGLWMNTTKNPRLRLLTFPNAQVTLEVPKQIALASVALRVHHAPHDAFATKCTNGYLALGGVLMIELLGMPAQAKHVRNWTLRALTPLATSVQRIPYPIPPAGADATTIASLEAAPINIQMTLDVKTLYLGTATQQGALPLEVAWWDGETTTWRQDQVTGTEFDATSGVVSFSTTHLGSLAVVLKRTALLPYRNWTCRPTGGKGGATVHVSVNVGLPEGNLEFACSPHGCALLGPDIAALRDLLSIPNEPRLLLVELTRRGLPLSPDDSDAALLEPGVCSCKDSRVEALMCTQIGLASGAFLIASSQWNKTTMRDECLVRMSEVLDWEGGGRTEPEHLERIFYKERFDKPNRVLCVMQRGERGVAFVDALNRNGDGMAPLPPFGAPELDTSLYGEVHANLFALLRGTETPGLAQSPLAAQLRVSSDETLQLMRDFEPRTAAVVSNLLMGLRVFSFG